MSQKIADNYLKAWRLFITSHAKIIQKIDADLAEAGQISLSWYDVLIEIYEAPEKRLRMNEVAERVVLSRSGLTRLVDRLEEKGFLRREIDANDRRGFFLTITEAGTDALRLAWPIYARGIQEHFANVLDEEESVILARAFGKILNRL